MSDIDPGLLRSTDNDDSDAAPVASISSSSTAGQLLRQARLRSGLTLEQLAERVKVNVARLQALEEDRFEAWPNTNGLRAAAATVCRHVQLDSAVILDRLPKAEKIQLIVAGPESNTGIQDSSGFTLRRNKGGDGMPMGVAIAAAILLIAALVYWSPRGMDWAGRVFDREAPAAVPSVSGAVTDPVLPPDAGPKDTRVGAPPPEASASKAELAAPALASPGPSASSVLPAATVAKSPEPMVVIKAKGLTWIAVSDAKGVTLLRKTLSAGETASASSTALPLWVVVGRADNAEVQVRGETVTLEPSVPDNVARFKVQ